MTWADVLLVFLRAAFLSVNGGTTLALLEQDLVGRLHVLSHATFATGVAIGSASPGPLGFGCIALGFLADRWRGALVAAFTSWLPAFLAIPLRAGYRKLEGRPWITGVNWGVAAGGAGLLAALLINLGRTAIGGIPELVLAAAALVLLSRKVPAVAVLALAAVVGAIVLRGS